MHRISAAHRTLPFGTWIEVRNLDNGRRLRVRINDRGPFVKRRILDVSYAAAVELDMVSAGVAKVELRVVDPTPVRASAAGFAVQIGAFRDRARARRLARELKTRPAARVYSDGEWHRVQVRGFRRREKAARLQRKLQRRGTPARIVVVPSMER